MIIDWELLNKRTRGELSVEENSLFERWLGASEENKLFYKRFLEREDKQYGADHLPCWRASFVSELQAVQRKQKRATRFRLIGYAASVLVVISISIALLNNGKEEPSDEKKMARAGITLTTSAGEQVEIKQLLSDEVRQIDGSEVTITDNALIYSHERDSTENERVKYNTVYTSRGNEYQITLADGTTVWLNSDTELKYPIAFNGKERKVFLKGEAFFDVKHDASKPFLVEFAGSAVQVLGTEFNIRSRNPEEQYISLVAGSVSVSNKAENALILSPGETVRASALGLTRVDADIQQFISWKNGLYFFENATIEKIMNELSLWYDFDVSYQGSSVKSEKFSGWLKRYESFNAVLEIIGKTAYVTFDVHENSVIVKPLK